MSAPLLDAAALDGLARRRLFPLLPADEAALIAQSRLALTHGERIATLETELAAEKALGLERVRANVGILGELVTASARANALRGAAESLLHEFEENELPWPARDRLRALLVSTPAADLSAYRESVINACVLEMERRGWLRADAMHELTEEGFVRAYAAQEVKP